MLTLTPQKTTLELLNAVRSYIKKETQLVPVPTWDELVMAQKIGANKLDLLMTNRNFMANANLFFARPETNRYYSNAVEILIAGVENDKSFSKDLEIPQSYILAFVFKMYLNRLNSVVRLVSPDWADISE